MLGHADCFRIRHIGCSLSIKILVPQPWQKAIVTVFFWLVSSSALADSCNANSIDGLKTLLKENSPFVGSWKKGSEDLPIKLVFQQIGEQYFAVANLGNLFDDGLGDREMDIRFVGKNRVILKGNTLGLSSIRKIRLTLNTDCSLVARKMLLLPGVLTSSSSKVDSISALVKWLVNQETYQGKWRWSGLSGDVGLSFMKVDGGLAADFSITTSGGVSYTDPAVPVIILSPSLMFMPVRLSTHNAYTGPVRLWLNPDHSLGGVSYSAPEPYKLKLKLFAQ